MLRSVVCVLQVATWGLGVCQINLFLHSSPVCPGLAAGHEETGIFPQFLSIFKLPLNCWERAKLLLVIVWCWHDLAFYFHWRDDCKTPVTMESWLLVESEVERELNNNYIKVTTITQVDEEMINQLGSKTKVLQIDFVLKYLCDGKHKTFLTMENTNKIKLLS